MSGFIRSAILVVLGIALCFFTLIEVNFNLMQAHSQRAFFALVGLMACFIWVAPRADDRPRRMWLGVLDWLLAGLTAFCFGYIIVQTEPLFSWSWHEGVTLGRRVARETPLDIAVGIAGLVLVLEAARRSIGWIVPLLAILFCLHSLYCYAAAQWDWPPLPDWMLPHSGQPLDALVSTTFLQSQGVLGQAMKVMFQFVFLFILFGAVLEMSGATEFIIKFSQRVFGRSAGGPAKVAVLASGMMGSLSGSAVANAVTTGAFTIPMMRNSGFKSHDAAAVEAAAGSGGALVPPVMGAAAYMMLEFIEPPVSYFEIVRAAIIPAVLYYWSLFVGVHLYARRLEVDRDARQELENADGSDSSSNREAQQPAVGTTPGNDDKADMSGLEPGSSVAPPAIAAFAKSPAPPFYREGKFDLRALRGVITYEGIIFATALATLVALLTVQTAFRAVTGAMAVTLLMTIFGRRLNLSTGARVLAVSTFVAAVAIHQVYLRAFTDYFELSQTAARQLTSAINSVAIGLLGLLGFALVHPQWRGTMAAALRTALINAIPLITAAACVGIIIGVVQQSGIANDFSAAMKGLVEHSLLLALMGIMLASIILGMSVPSVVCYLLIATIMGSLLENLGVAPLAAHLFIFYFGMMSMVTPPVALAAYAAASIAGANAMRASLSAFKFALVGFTLPFMFIYRPSLLLLSEDGGPLTAAEAPFFVVALVAAIVGIVALASFVQGFFRGPLGPLSRAMMLLASVLLISPDIGGPQLGLFINVVGLLIFGLVAAINWRRE